jgi:Methyltransferase domain
MKQNDLHPNQSPLLLQELHLLTREGNLNQDARRKLKQVYHLYQFIEPFLKNISSNPEKNFHLVDHGAGKSYLGFILYDLFFKNLNTGKLFGIETREELVQKSIKLADKLKFNRMTFLNLSVEQSITSNALPDEVEIVTALHACDTATDDAIKFALHKKSNYIILIPCCQAEVASLLRKDKGRNLSRSVLTEIYRHPHHTREFGSQLTNVIRSLWLESFGYQVTVTEFTGWEHSLKNELIIAEYKDLPREYPRERLKSLLERFFLDSIHSRYI